MTGLIKYKEYNSRRAFHSGGNEAAAMHSANGLAC
jgi:hypothetical protein